MPFTLQEVGLNQIQKCSSSTKADWAKRATDPELSPQPDYSSVPDPPISLHVLPKSRHLCNTYIPSNSTASIERLLWTIQYLVASGFYVVVSISANQCLIKTEKHQDCISSHDITCFGDWRMPAAVHGFHIPMLEPAGFA